MASFVSPIKQFFSKHSFISFFLLVVVWIFFFFLKIAFSLDGYLSSDSTYYLQLAKDFSYKNIVLSPWPLGYPLSIYLVSLFSGLDVFWASKLLNVILLLCIMIVLLNYFKVNKYVFIGILFMGAFWKIFLYSWSELLFVTLLMILSYFLYIFEFEEKRNWWNVFFVILISFASFLARYIGIYLILVFAFLILKNFKEKEKMKKYFFILTMLVFLISGYLFSNYWYSGYFTGVPRQKSSLSFWEMCLDFFKSLLEYISVIDIRLDRISSLVLTLILIFIGIRKREEINSFFTKYYSQKIYIFFLMAINYFIVLFFLRLFFDFDRLDMRLLFPGMFFITLGLLEMFFSSSNKKIRNFFLLLLCLSFIINGPFRIAYNIHRYPLFYNKHIENLEKIFSKLKEDAVVIMGSPHLRYIYPQLRLVYPEEKKEDLRTFFKNLLIKNKVVYLYIPYYWNSFSKDYLTISKESEEILKKFPPGSLIKIVL